jgi:hypothetical protein
MQNNVYVSNLPLGFLSHPVLQNQYVYTQVNNFSGKFYLYNVPILKHEHPLKVA